MIYAIKQQENYVLKFKYDPEFVLMVKTVPGREWHPQEKYWTIPVTHIGWLIKATTGTAYENCIQIISDEHINENANIDETTNIPNIDISDVDLVVQDGYKLYEHQLDFLKYAKAKNKKGFILADEMGCGKTLETINYALYQRKRYGYKHCLIITCVNAAKYAWQADIAKHTNGKEQAYILGSWVVSRGRNKGTIRYTGSSIDKFKDLRSGHMYGDAKAPKLPFFLVMNIETLRLKTGKMYPIVDILINMINAGNIPMIAIDECHVNMSPSSVQGKCILEIKKKTGTAAQWIPITGTPIRNKPTDVYTPLKLVDGHAFKSYYQWTQQFCIYGGYGDHEIIGYKNIPILKDMLQGNMIRRTTDSVLDLPPIIRYTEFVENTAYQQKLYDNIEDYMREHLTDIFATVDPLTRFLRLRQVNGSPELVDEELVVDNKYLSKNAKLTRLIELVDDAVGRGSKVVIFSNWVKPLRTIYRFISKRYKTCCYTGTMKEADREKHKNVFINNPEYKVMLGTIEAMGKSITLTVANTVIFYDDCWTPDDKEQAIKRCNRIGSTKPLSVFTLITKDTVDERVRMILDSKSGIAKYIVDGKLDLHNNPDMIRDLLNIK